MAAIRELVLNKFTMNDKEKADIYSGLAKLRMEHLGQTRDLEFKVNIALWTVIVVAGSFLYGKAHIQLSWYVLISLLIIFTHVFAWLLPVQFSQDRDNDLIEEYRKRVESLLGQEADPLANEKWGKLPRKWYHKVRKGGFSWVIFEVIFTAVLLLCVYLLLSFAPMQI